MLNSPTCPRRAGAARVLSIILCLSWVAGEPPLRAENALGIQDQLVLPGQEEVWFPLLVSNDEPIQGFQVLATVDSSFLRLRGHSLDYTVTQALSPEFLEVKDRGTHVEIGCLFDFLPPFESRQLFPGSEEAALQLIFDIVADAPAGAQTRIEIVNDPRLSQILNIFTANGRSLTPRLGGATVRIASTTETAALFLRGDVDGNNTHNLNDVLVTLNYLFLNGPVPRCLDAADFEDAGRINLVSVLALLNFVFLDGAPPAIPFPRAGLDPTEDSLNCR